MLRNIISSVIIAVVVALGCILLGAVLDLLKVDIAIVIGLFLKTYGSVIGILAGLWYFIGKTNFGGKI